MAYGLGNACAYTTICTNTDATATWSYCAASQGLHPEPIYSNMLANSQHLAQLRQIRSVGIGENGLHFLFDALEKVRVSLSGRPAEIALRTYGFGASVSTQVGFLNQS